MKRLFLFLLPFLMTVNVMAEGHLKFKGVEINGTPKDFVQKLIEKGCKFITKEDEIYLLIGDFASYNNCEIGVMAFDNMVTKVAVQLPGGVDSWSVLYNQYTTLKDMLTQKYGQPVIDVEEWQGYGGKPTDDNSCMHELRMDRAKIGCGFQTTNGSIELVMLSMKMECRVWLTYTDAMNTNTVMDSAMEDL